MTFLLPRWDMFVPWSVLYSSHNYIPRFSANSPLHPKNRPHTCPHPKNSPSNSSPFVFPMFFTQTKTIKVYNEIIPNGIIPFHRLCHPIGRHPISKITCHCAQSQKKHLRDEFVVKKQVVSTPATSRFFAVGRGVYFVSVLLGVERFFYRRRELIHSCHIRILT